MDQNTISALIGDTSVPEQLGAALEHVAAKEHSHDEYATTNEVEELKRKIDALMNLVGDTPVSEQIAEALKNIK
jgi:hypothetical protein